jgi:hypothetical protein
MYTVLLDLFSSGFIGFKSGQFDGMIFLNAYLLLIKDSFLSANIEAVIKTVFCEGKQFHEAASEYISVLRECASGRHCIIQ